MGILCNLMIKDLRRKKERKEEKKDGGKEGRMEKEEEEEEETNGGKERNIKKNMIKKHVNHRIRTPSMSMTDQGLSGCATETFVLHAFWIIINQKISFA